MNVELKHFTDIPELINDGLLNRHLSFNYFIDGISRACLQEICRHRTFSFSVKSSRYTLSKDLKKEEVFNGLSDKERASKYIVLTGDDRVDEYSIQALNNLRSLVKEGLANDVLKYAMPECYKVSLALTADFDSLQNFFKLRTSSHALKEIRQLAFQMFHQLPVYVRPLFLEVIDFKSMI